MTIPSGFGQITIAHIGGGIVGEAVWTLGFDNNAGDTAAEIASNTATNLSALDYTDLLSASVTVTEVRVKLGPDATGPSAVETFGDNGTVGGHAAPPNVAMLVHKNTPLGGRQGRGRLFVPGLAEAALDQNGLLTGEQVTAAQTFFTGLAATMILGAIPAHLLHANALSPTAIDSLIVDSLSATQRRRLRR